MATNFNIFTIQHNDLLPARGSTLISEPFMKDVYFQRAVVLLVEHDTEGSMGFVLNKKTDLIVNDFFPELENVPDLPIFLGGPISSNKLFFIHSLAEPAIPGTFKLKDNLYFDGDFDILKEIIKSGYPIEGRVKFFLGYSGWEKGQLKNEIEGNSWMVSHSSTNGLMMAEGEEFWKQSLELLGNRYKHWTKFPKDPDLN